MLKEIGSNFWLSQGDKEKSRIDDRIFNVGFEDKVFTSSGRSAISLILDEIGNNKRCAMLPSFTCESVIEPFLCHEYQIAYYSVDKELCIVKKRFMEEVKANDPSVILIHNYFGFNTTSSIRDTIDELRRQGIVIIEDITQILYSDFSRLPANYYVGSFRKWAGIPDGGFALKGDGVFTDKPTNEDELLTETKVDAMKAKYNYLFHNTGNKNDFLKMFAKAEDVLERQKEIYRMSDISYREQANLNIDSLKERRRENFLFLLNNIKTSSIRPLFSYLPDDVTPLYFPVLCGADRMLFQKWLRMNHIFAPIVWPKPECIPDAVIREDCFYTDLLCIPCDQRYGVEEMKAIVDCIKSFKKTGVLV